VLLMSASDWPAAIPPDNDADPRRSNVCWPDSILSHSPYPSRALCWFAAASDARHARRRHSPTLRHLFMAFQFRTPASARANSKNCLQCCQ
jgi:hypothetical protein